MIYIETLERKSNQKYDDFRDMVQERINLVTMYNPKNLLNISWICDCDSYYADTCIITYYKENT